VKFWLPAAVALAFMSAIGSADAYIMVCPDAALKKYDYGTKARLTFSMSPARLSDFTSEIEHYSVSGMHFSGSAEGRDPYSNPPKTRLDQFLRSSSYDISILVSSSNVSHIVHVSVGTSSSTCGATEDWHPYWREFRAFLVSKGYLRKA
jgi:hypothetical protein